MTKTDTIFKNDSGRELFISAYNEAMKLWTFPHETFEIATEYGTCHVIASGPADGQPILLFHGMTGNSTMWYETVGSLQSYRTYCIDTPGDFGKSTINRRIKTLEDGVKWIDQILDALSLPSAILIGHSMGGWFCANYALQKSDRIQRLVLIAPVATFKPIPFFKLMRYIYPAMLLPNENRIKRAWKIFCSPGYEFPDAIMNMVVAGYTYCRSKLPVIPRVYPNEVWSSLSKLPVLFLVGADEQIYNTQNVVDKVNKVLPHATTKIIPKSGHCLTVEQPQDVNREINTFLSKNKSQAV